MFTYSYKQPDEYHFSMDSIHLAEFVASQLQNRADLESLRVLDLCAGCGVIGFELSWYAPKLRKLDFIEVQDIYTDYFYENSAIVHRPELQLRWHNVNYETLLAKNWENKFDLIVSNPPYFHPDHGMLSPSNFKNRCRFFLDSSFENYIRALTSTLASKGEAYFLLRPSKQHGYDLFFEAQKLLSKENFSIKKISHIRGTDIIFLQKL